MSDDMSDERQLQWRLTEAIEAMQTSIGTLSKQVDILSEAFLKLSLSCERIASRIEEHDGDAELG